LQNTDQLGLSDKNSITVAHPDAEYIKYGFDGSTVVKVGGVFHSFSSEMVDDHHWVKMQLGHWSSTNRFTWNRIGNIAASSGNFDGVDPRAVVWSPMTAFDSAENRGNFFMLVVQLR
jgi:hypothetical protein